MVTWKKLRTFNYYPTITAIEVQLKQNRFLDQWKTVDTIQMSDNAFKEKVSKNKQVFEKGELTDCESDSDLDERNEIELHCFSMNEKLQKLEKRMEFNSQENVLPLYRTVEDLNPSMKYSIRVRFANKYGWGSFSSALSFCIKDLSETFDKNDYLHLVTYRNSLAVDGTSNTVDDVQELDASVINEISQAIELQSQKAVLSPSEMLSKLLADGVDYLHTLVENKVDLSTIRNANGMSILHAAAAASNSSTALPLVEEIVSNNLLSVNDCSKVWGCGTDG